MDKNFKVELNNPNNIRDLLQNAYKLADGQIVQAQNEINKMSSATDLKNETMDGKSRYGKIINDYLGIKDKAISKKLDIFSKRIISASPMETFITSFVSKLKQGIFSLAFDTN